MSQHDDFASPIEAQLAAPPSTAAELDNPALSNAKGSVGNAPPGYGGAEKLIQSKLAVLACLFLVTGFLGLPLLWMNRGFSTVERLAWATVVTIYTLALIGLVVAIFFWCYKMVVG
ncbi:MAG TPA: hypothetical protein DEF45_02605 [Rhodopirellula sp.]|nr:MAG: hypothetical protein CBD74_08660 [Saprospirales bacterium TMED214]HBV61891.1 hypothetical protein [Rhodopirellula sp.]